MSTTKTLRRALPNRDYLQVTVEVRENDPRLSDGVVITADLWDHHGRFSGLAAFTRGTEPNACGMLHDEILTAFPRLAPVIAVHGCDLDGVPTHAVANGWYFYRGGHVAYETKNYGEDYVNRHGTPHERAARSLHVDPAALPSGLDEEGFKAFADSLRPLWAERMRQAREVIASL